MATCPNCKGTGGVICDYCKGRGYFIRTFLFSDYKEKCQRCNETGTRKCGVCGGTGRV